MINLNYKRTGYAALIKTAVTLLVVAQAMPVLAACWDATRPDSRYIVDSGGGTVIDTDPSSKLMWSRCAAGLSGADCATGNLSALGRSAAASAAVASSLGGYNDWRLPTQTELLALVASTCGNPTLNATVFPATPGSDFWTSTDDPAIPGNALTVLFSIGFVGSIGTANPLNFRLVRGGAPFDAQVTTAQTVVFGAPPALGVGATFSLNFAGSSSPNSGNPIRLASTTPLVCSVDAAGVVNGLAAGACSISANRNGRVYSGVNYAPAAPVSLAFDFGCWNGGIVPKTSSQYVMQSSTGTVVDRVTNLMWKQCAEGLSGSNCGSGNVSILDWAAGKEAAKNSTAVGYNDWRMPSLDELKSLVPNGCQSFAPVINAVAFPNTAAEPFWTGLLENPSNAWVVNFASGYEGLSVTSYNFRIRLVRGGQAFDPLAPTPQNLTFSVTPTLVLGSVATVTATSAAPNSGNPVIYASTSPAVCAVNATSGAVSLAANAQAGDTCTVTANQFGGLANGKNYAPAVQAAQGLVVSKVAQTLVFGVSPAVTVGSTGTLSALSNRALTPVTFLPATPSVCTVGGTNGSIVTGIGVGTCTVTASQPGDNTYLAATASQSFSVGPATQTLRFGNAPFINLGGNGTVSAVSSRGLTPVLLTSLTQPVCLHVGGGAVVGISIGLCTIQASQDGNANVTAVIATQSFSIGAATQTLSFSTTPRLNVGGSGALSATSSIGLTPVALTSLTLPVCTIANGQVTGVATGTCTIQAYQAGNDNAASATVNTSFAVDIATAIGIPCNLRMDGLNPLSALKEGLILTRAMLGLTGTAVTEGTGITTPWETLRDQLNAHCGTSFQ